MNLLATEQALQARYQLQGHTVAYLTVTATGSELVCTECGGTVHVYDNGNGWGTSSRTLDKPCP